MTTYLLVGVNLTSDHLFARGEETLMPSIINIILVLRTGPSSLRALISEWNKKNRRAESFISQLWLLLVFWHLTTTCQNQRNRTKHYINVECIMLLSRLKNFFMWDLSTDPMEMGNIHVWSEVFNSTIIFLQANSALSSDISVYTSYSLTHMKVISFKLAPTPKKLYLISFKSTPKSLKLYMFSLKLTPKP